MALLINVPKDERSRPGHLDDTSTIHREPHHSAVVDSRYQSRESLLTHVSGKQWIVDYYQQKLGQDDEPNHYSDDTLGAYQQYLLIRSMEIRVQDELDSTQNPETQSFDTTGSALLYPPHVPHVADVFLADTRDGRLGMYRVTEVETLSIDTAPCYLIRYVLTSVATQEDVSNLQQKVIKTVFFVRQNLINGLNPYLIDEEYKALQSLELWYQQLVERYFGYFYHPSTGTFVLPSQSSVTYDDFVVGALLKILSFGDHAKLQHVRRYDIKPSDQNLPNTLWDVLFERQPDQLRHCAMQLAVVDSLTFGHRGQLRSIAYSNIEGVVYPQFRIRLTAATYSPIEPGQSIYLDPIYTPSEDEASALSVRPVTFDAYYVLSEDFYAQRWDQCSLFERTVGTYMTDEVVDPSELLAHCEESDQWGDLEQFYYLPILLMMIRWRGVR